MLCKKQKKRPKEKPIKIGTVIEIPLTESPVMPGFAYAQYFCQYFYSSKKFEHGLRVFKGIFQERPDDLVALTNQMEQLIVFCPITHGIACGLCEVVGCTPIPKRLQKLPLFKSLSMFSPYRWHLKNVEVGELWRVGVETGDYQKVGEILPEEFHHLPSWWSVSYPFLLDLIELGWTNESDFYENFYEARKRLLRVQGYIKTAVAEEAVTKSLRKKTTKIDCSDSMCPNPIAEPLKQLLTRMNEIEEIHDELCDTHVRDQVHDAIFDAFILPKSDYILPDGFGMSSRTGDKCIRSALVTFIRKATNLATKANLEPGLPRLASFQDGDVASKNGTTYDEYFGDRPVMSLSIDCPGCKK